MLRRFARLISLTTLVLALGVLSAACGGDDADTKDTAASDTKTTAPDTTTTAGGGATVAAGATLTGVVGPDFSISLKDDKGADVSQLAAGDYTIKISDKSEAHNFHLTGTGVDESTTVEEVTDTEWKVSFSAGEYTYVCDPHASSMSGKFTVA